MAEEEKSKDQQIEIYYQRSRHYRTVHADGVQSGITPRGNVQFMLFSELKPTPEFVLHRITPEGVLGEEIERVVKEGIIREAEVNVVMDVATTTQFIDLLQRMLKQLEAFQKAQAKPGDTTEPPKTSKRRDGTATKVNTKHRNK